MTPRVVFFLLSSLVILGACAAYVHRRASSVAALGARGQRVLWAVLLGGVGLWMATRLLERWASQETLLPFGLAGGLVGVGLLITAPLLLAADLVAAAISWARAAVRIARPRSMPEEPAAPPTQPVVMEEAPAPASPAPAAPAPALADVSRRGFITQALTGSALAVGGGSAVYGTFFGRHDYALEELAVAIPGLSRRLDGYTLVQLSDIHLGLFSGELEARAAEDLVRRARPDLIVLTGDLVDHDPAYAPALGRLVRRLAALARGGVIAVPGNHDYFTGIDPVVGALEGAGAVVLRNGGRVIGDRGAGFALLGVDDQAGISHGERGPDLALALAALPAAADLPRVLLCHNPAYFSETAGRVALQLSGHTHGGQLKIGVSPASMVLGHPFLAGRYERSGSQIYVNRGFGTAGPPTRVGAPPEVTRIVLTA